jgi:hypothetical protein
MSRGFCLLASFLILFLCLPSAAACEADLPLIGTALVAGCDSDEQDCIPGANAVHTYSEAFPDTDAEIVIALPSSPWHFYGPDGRIISVDEMVAILRPYITDKSERVVLLGSWTGGGEAPLAQQVADGLGSLPVEGVDGFLWLSADGSTRITKQAYTVRQGGGFYQVTEGADVLVPMTHGWASGLEDQFIAKGDTGLLLHAAIGWDVFHLCRDKALAGFELAAKHGDPVAAYNAAFMRLERGAAGDRGAALALLEKAAAQGDEKSKARLATLNAPVRFD